MAHNIDLLFLLMLFYPSGYLVPDNRFFFLLCVLFTILYEGLFEWSHWAGTPGKKLMKIEVKSGDGKKISLLRAVARTSLKFISFGLFFLGFIMILFDSHKRGFHDLVTGCIVVFKDPH